ncbi:MAG TPA: alpha-amylase/4-alpha-glucanotransferase domain-containing protein [Methylomirabilota bacterium]|nr:alpha-amylase/4-alpha-glucanotransferase domain-containing protein [Methylomirabilota bacterium]
MSRSREPLAFCFGVHDHQPIGNFDGVLVETTERAYRPFLELVRARRDVRLSVHCTGSLLAWLREHARPTFDLLGDVVAAGQVELLTGGFYEPILAVLPDADKRGQIQRLTEFLRREFGVSPRGMWLAERVWEPQLPRALREAGVEYVLVDDSHFALAGLDAETLGGYYLTEDQGATVAVFPISQRLRYLIPFDEVGKTLEYLEGRRDAVPSVTVVDDGEKFGAWPGTHEHVYRDGWLDRFFDAVLSTPWLRMTTFAEVLDRIPASGRVYLPTASYREMGEWSLPAEAAEALERVRRDLGPLDGGAAMAAMLRGGFWRGFLVKYPEVADMYWKMLRLSRALSAAQAARPAEPRLAEAREALWRGQANDAYWHGVFGGCYLPHLRRAVKSALLEAEVALDAVVPPPPPALADVNGDGAPEVVLRTPALAVTLAPAEGGTLTELAYRPRALDLGDVLTRRREAYHARLAAPAPDAGAAHTIHDSPAHKEAGLAERLAYDAFRRASLLDGLFGGDAPLDPVDPWRAALAVHGATRCHARVEPAGDGAVITLTPEVGAAPGLLEKRVSIAGSVVRADYRVTCVEPARWAVQWNVALTGGDAPGRYLTLPGSPSLGSRGRVGDVQSVTLVDEWIGVRAQLAWSPRAELAWGPVETVSVSESGFERIYQGLALLLAWPLAGGPTVLWTSLTVSGG